MSDPISNTKIHIRLVRDRPADFFQVVLGDTPDGECACGSSLSEALRALADRLDFVARRRFEEQDLIRRLFPEERNEAK